MIDNKLLVPKRAIFNIIGALCTNPQYVSNIDYSLNINDFEEQFYKIIYTSINNIAINNFNVGKITPKDVDDYLSDNEQAYNLFKINDGLQYINDAIEQTNIETFEINYKLLKKFTLLRDFNSNGFDILDIYNPYDTSDNIKMENFKNYELNDIVNKINQKLLNVKNNWSLSEQYKSYEASHNIDTLLDRLSQAPDFGVPFFNGYYNAVFRGMRFGKLMLKSAGTGVGKTRTALLDIVSVSISETYDIQRNIWVKNSNKVYPTTFISTELEIQELQTCLLAIISGVSEEKILKSNYDTDTFERIKKAIDILKISPISLHWIDDFSIGDIEQIIEKDILTKQSQFIFFDYLQITPKLSRTIQEEYKLGLREDQILQNFSSRLKGMAQKYNVFISTATQLNANSNDRTQRDASAIRGGRAVVDKVDFAIQMYRASKEDLSKVSEITDTLPVKPNFMHIIYKNRSGRNNLIIWTYLDSSNMREKVLFVTDVNNELIADIKPMTINLSN